MVCRRVAGRWEALTYGRHSACVQGVAGLAPASARDIRTGGGREAKRGQNTIDDEDAEFGGDVSGAAGTLLLRDCTVLP